MIPLTHPLVPPASPINCDNTKSHTTCVAHFFFLTISWMTGYKKGRIAKTIAVIQKFWVAKHLKTLNSWTAFTSESHVVVTCYFEHKWVIQSAALQTKAMLNTSKAWKMSFLQFYLSLHVCIYMCV